jgi:SsrA-binding protein
MKLPKDYSFSYNRKSNDFAIEETMVAGIMLVGREIKSIIEKEVDLTGSYILLKKNLTLVGSHIKVVVDNYSTKYEANRDRVLLVKKNELEYLKDKKRRGAVFIPIKLFNSERGKVKLLFGIGKPIKSWDKREKEKEKQIKKEIYAQ